MRRKEGSVVKSIDCIDMFEAREDDLLRLAVVSLEGGCASALEVCRNVGWHFSGDTTGIDVAAF